MARTVKSNTEVDWLPEALDPAHSPYFSLVMAIEAAIESGKLRAGDRLPPHRALSDRLGVSIATVTKAYNEAQRRDLVVGERGRGMFVKPPGESAQIPNVQTLINLGYNFAPEVGQGSVLAQTIRTVMADDFDATLLSFQSHQGLPTHREAVAGWMARTYGGPLDAGNVVLTNGAQHALSIAVAILRRRPDEPIMVEQYAYSGFKALAETYNIPLVPLPMDGMGVIPQDFERIAKASNSRILLTNPTIQSPTATTMPIERRKAIADVLRRISGWVIEDDVFGYLAEPPLPSISSLIPDRSIYMISFGKILGMGLRLGAVHVPASLADPAALAMRATTWSASPIMSELVTRLILSGELDRLSQAIQDESRARRQIVKTVFGNDYFATDPGGYHVWLPVPPDRDATDVFIAARARGLLVTPPGFAVDGAPEHALRICLGGQIHHDQLRDALETLKRLIARTALTHILMT